MTSDRPGQEARSGPFLGAALLCEKVLIEADGTISAIRILDQVTIAQVTVPQGHGPVEPVDLQGRIQPPIQPSLQVFLLVMLKSGNARGKRLLGIQIIAPDDRRTDLAPREIELSAQFNGGAAAVYNLNLSVRGSGTYRFEISLDGEYLTTAPLLVEFAGSSPQSSPSPSTSQG